MLGSDNGWGSWDAKVNFLFCKTSPSHVYAFQGPQARDIGAISLTRKIFKVGIQGTPDSSMFPHPNCQRLALSDQGFNFTIRELIGL